MAWNERRWAFSSYEMKEREEQSDFITLVIRVSQVGHQAENGSGKGVIKMVTLIFLWRAETLLFSFTKTLILAAKNLGRKKKEVFREILVAYYMPFLTKDLLAWMQFHVWPQP